MNTFNRIIRPAFIGIVTLSAIASVPAAARTNEEQPPTVKVGYADLDLTTEAGQVKLHRRIVSAAKSVCPFDGMLHDMPHMRLQRDCMDTALASAEIKVAQAVDAANPHGQRYALAFGPARR
jgi:UrcA family protein